MLISSGGAQRPSYIGELRSHFIEHRGERYKVLRLVAVSAPKRELPVSDLYEPVLLGFAPLAFRVRGFERVDGPDGRFTVIQEWHVEEP